MTMQNNAPTNSPLPPSTAPALQRGRIVAIDVFRALTVLVMLTVNTWHGVTGIPPWLKHMAADADAMSFTDAVFPAFLFIVGMSIPFALQQRQAHSGGMFAGFSHVLQRALGLVVIGFFMVNAEDGYAAASMPIPIGIWALLLYLAAFLLWGSVRGGPAFGGPVRLAGAGLLGLLALAYRGGPDGSGGMTPQWWGILGLIGWAYLIVCLAYKLTRGRLIPLLLCVVLCVLYFIADKQFSGNLAATASTNWLALLLSQDAHASHAAIVFCGCITALLFFDARLKAGAPLALAIGFALLLALAASWLRPEYKISKIHATPSWALYSSAACVIIFAVLQYGLALTGKQQTPRWLAPVATHPLVAYLIPFIVGALMQALHWEWPQVLFSGWPGWMFGIGYTVLIALATHALAACGVRLRL